MIKACQSLTSRGYLKTQFSWQWYYYTLTPEGLDYLREWLHLPAEIVPQTHIKQQRSHAPPRGMMGGDDRERRGGGRGGPRGDRDRGDYRRRDAGEGKEGGAPGEFKPDFRGGFGTFRNTPSICLLSAVEDTSQNPPTDFPSRPWPWRRPSFLDDIPASTLLHLLHIMLCTPSKRIGWVGR